LNSASAFFRTASSIRINGGQGAFEASARQFLRCINTDACCRWPFQLV